MIVTFQWTFDLLRHLYEDCMNGEKIDYILAEIKLQCKHMRVPIYEIFLLLIH